ncbi:FMN-binding negative transcriptional regulator [Agrococcus baldri]|uniref:Protease synthase and sporulation protein PAI 2 n=1 Tax=Agrococcus baldri TaxID=153730 RepID=A0AA87RIG0_9MICO|nr:FMN-binding negative transcriptional regulator [Agrococcus baldri]GEK79953.1 protease synthase and sporulation protein PAI 2 [Agrococcus baldri]
MHTYPSYHAPDGRAIVDFVARTPFALAVTSQAGAPIATHVPVVVPPGLDVASADTLVGTTLWSHMGHANRHWRLMEDRPEVLLIHSSSHGYVSPTLYEKDPSVPTVDYTAVHLTGTVRLLHTDDEALAVVEQTVRQLEGTREKQWDMTASLDVFRAIIGGVKAFTIDITAEQAVFKLSQDKPADVRARVRDEFAGAAVCPHADLAGMMDALPAEHVRRGHYPPLEDA